MADYKGHGMFMRQGNDADTSGYPDLSAASGQERVRLPDKARQRGVTQPLPVESPRLPEPFGPES